MWKCSVTYKVLNYYGISNSILFLPSLPLFSSCIYSFLFLSFLLVLLQKSLNICKRRYDNIKKHWQPSPLSFNTYMLIANLIFSINISSSTHFPHFRIVLKQIQNIDHTISFVGDSVFISKWQKLKETTTSLLKSWS